MRAASCGTSFCPTCLPGGCVTVAGLVLVRQRPGTGNAIFMTLEDETGIANTILWPRVFESFRPVVMGARLISVTGELQNEKGVIHIVARGFEDLTPLLRRLSEAATSSILPHRPTKPSGRCRAHGAIRARPCCLSTRRSRREPQALPASPLRRFIRADDEGKARRPAAGRGPARRQSAAEGPEFSLKFSLPGRPRESGDQSQSKTALPASRE